ncbi:MAG: hypothetical protein C4524_00595 [Candidatus Zixiibacteriota bacterium]|nr:MAG: hypothetical protein C4524_00595 [candidate division Zixibacteria bacterium]
MKTTLRFAILSAVATYMLIFTGGLVRASGAGLGCPDWPRCFGRWIPPTNLSQLPPDIDPAQFNFTLAWIEYLNRLLGVVTGTLILITAILAFRHFLKVPRIVVPAAAAALLVAYTGWQGGQVVESHLESTLVSIHAVFAVLIGVLMVWVAQQVYYRLEPQAEQGGSYPAGLKKWIPAILGVALVQVLLGTNMRSTIEAFYADRPLAGAFAWLEQAGFLNHLHMGLGLLVVVPGVIVALKLLSARPSPLVWQGAWAVILLAAAQAIFGALLVLLGDPELMAILHLWTAALIAGMLLLLYAALKQREGEPRAVH